MGTYEQSLDPLNGLRAGDRVVKHQGDSHPSGTVVAVFATTKGRYRVVVELDYADLLHIYSPSQLSRLGPADAPTHPFTPAPFFPLKCQMCGKESGHPMGEACPALQPFCLSTVSTDGPPPTS